MHVWFSKLISAVLTDIIARVLNRPGTVLAVVLHISKAFENFSLLDKRKFYRISDQVFCFVSFLFSVFCYQNLPYGYVRSLSYMFVCYRYVCVDVNVPAMIYTM